MLVDAHCHLDHPDFKDDLDEVIDAARKAGVKAIVANGLGPGSNRKVIELAEKYDIVQASLGIYPPDALEKEDVAEWAESFDVDSEIEFIRKSNPAGIGEVGLDYQNGSRIEEQKEIFRKMVLLAKELGKPISVHSRKAESDVLDILEQEKAEKVLLHCFCGSKKLVERGIQLGYYYTIPTNVVRAEQFMNMASMVNINKMLTETDSPYLSPYKDKRNEPAFVVEAVKKIAEIKGMTEDDVAKNIYMNYQALF